MLFICLLCLGGFHTSMTLGFPLPRTTGVSLIPKPVSPHSSMSLLDSYDVLQMPRCSHHYLGTGLGLGISWRPTLALIRTLRKYGNPALVYQLEKVLNGSSWSPTRRAAFFGCGTTCPRCGALDAGALHEYWECPTIIL